MIKENTDFFDSLIDKINEIIKNEKTNDAVPLFPMLRIEKNKLYIGTLIDIQTEELFNRDKVVRPNYWVLLDTNNYSLIELNNTKDKDYMDPSILPIDVEYDDEFKKEDKELRKYSINKNIQYREYLINDIKKDISNSQKNILENINNELIVDNQKVNAKDYLDAMIEDEIESRVKELVDLIVNNKYSSIIYYYQQLIEEIVKEYKNTNSINKDKIKLACKIMESYYGEYCGIKYFFNID